MKAALQFTSGPRETPAFCVSARSRDFLERFYPSASIRDWNDWRWQNRNRIRTLGEAAAVFDLSADEREAIRRHRGALPLGLTPYYASLLDPADAARGLRRTVVPVTAEYAVAEGEGQDPLEEESHSPVPGIVHRYPDRVLLLVTNFCSVYCRYCTRARMVGAAGEGSVKKTDLERALEYIEQTPAVRDVLISGGDPLSLDDERLEYVLHRLQKIAHVAIVRIGSKQPVVQPMRITPSLCNMLRRYHPLFMSLHFTHPDELTPEVAQACGRLADAGIPLGSQTVLLKGVNDDEATLKDLMHGLLKIRVRPYYLFQCDMISGSAHLRTPLERGVELVRGLHGDLSGYAVPSFVVEAPGGSGKVPLAPDYVAGRDGSDWLLTGYDGTTYRYPDADRVAGSGSGDT